MSEAVAVTFREVYNPTPDADGGERSTVFVVADATGAQFLVSVADLMPTADGFLVARSNLVPLKPEPAANV